DAPDEPIAASSDGLHVPGIGRGVRQRTAHFTNGIVQPIVEVDEGVGRPEPLAKLLSRDDVAWPLQECMQDLKRLFLNSKAAPMPAYLASFEIDFERTKSEESPFRIQTDAVAGSPSVARLSTRVRRSTGRASNPPVPSRLSGDSQVSAKQPAVDGFLAVHCPLCSRSNEPQPAALARRQHDANQVCGAVLPRHGSHNLARGH